MKNFGAYPGGSQSAGNSGVGLWERRSVGDDIGRKKTGCSSRAKRKKAWKHASRGLNKMESSLPEGDSGIQQEVLPRGVPDDLQSVR
jgi:hypothetical protein